MGRLIVYDNVVEDMLTSIFEEKKCQIGLMIGQCTDQKDIVLRLCKTPENDDLGEGDKSSKNQPFDIDEGWISQHGKQLLRALPGGLDILGVYVVVPLESATKLQTQLRQVLFQVFNTLSKNRSYQLRLPERILLTICPETHKMQCRTYNISDYKSTANPADWKLLTNPMRWQRVRCKLAVDIKFPIKSEDAGLSLQKQIEIGLHPFFENVQEAHALVNGIHRRLNELLEPNLDARRPRRQGANENEDEALLPWNDIELFIPLENNNNISPHEACDCICMMTFKGDVHCRAYLHSKATVREAINALKLDIIRSVTVRCEIQCEDLLLIEEEQKDPVVVHELPRRVFAPLPQGDLCVCDYQFPHDTAPDSLEAFKELLNLDLTQEDIDVACENSPNTSTLFLPDVQEDRTAEFTNNQEHSSPYRCFAVASAFTVALFAAYFMYSQSN